MSIDTQLRATTPTDLPPVDHDRLQRAGRRRRRAARLASGTAMAAVVAVAGVALAQLSATDEGAPMLGPGGPSADAPALETPVPAPEPPVEDEVDATDDADPDPQVVADFAELTHDEAVGLLEARLAATPERPADLVSIAVYEVADGDDVVEELRGDEGPEDFPVISVIHPDFDPTRGFETPAVQPTWDRDAAQLALAALAEHREVAGVTVDALGRTVVVLGPRGATDSSVAGEPPAQFVHVDPASGYTSGILFGADEWGTDAP